MTAVMNDVINNKLKLTEAKTVLQVLQLDVKNLSQKLLDLEKDLKGKHFPILNAQLALDSVRIDILRCRDKFRYHKNRKDELLLGNKTLRKELERLKFDINTERKHFETALSESNDISLKVRERTEEICTFSERIHSYERILLHGNSEITIREMEKAKLLSLADELRNHVLIVKKNQSDESGFWKKIKVLREQFNELTERRRKLEQEFNTDDDPRRAREVHFEYMKTRENIPALEKKLDTIEELLASRDAIGLERTLIENHITKLSDDCLARASYLRGTGGDVKSTVEMKKKLSHLSRKIDGLICENSIASAQAETAEAMFLKFRRQVAEAEDNFARGLPPTAEIEAEWNRQHWKNEMLQRAYQRPSGFLVKVNPRHGYQIKADAQLRGKRRELENPRTSPLGWYFSVISNPSTGMSTTAGLCKPEMTFLNSATNPRKASNAPVTENDPVAENKSAASVK